MKTITLSAGQYMVIVDTLIGSTRLSEASSVFNYTAETRTNLYNDITNQMVDITLSGESNEGSKMNTPVKQKPRTKVQLEKELANSLALSVKEAEFITQLKTELHNAKAEARFAVSALDNLKKLYNKIPRWVRNFFNA